MALAPLRVWRGDDRRGAGAAAGSAIGFGDTWPAFVDVRTDALRGSAGLATPRSLPPRLTPVYGAVPALFACLRIFVSR